MVTLINDETFVKTLAFISMSYYGVIFIDLFPKHQLKKHVFPK